MMAEAPRPFRNRQLIRWTVLMTALSVTTALTLKLMGRVVWCQCGSWIPWSWDIWSQHNSQHLIDPYFFTHVLHGIVLYGLLHWLWRSGSAPKRLLAAVLLETAWEVLENSPLIIDRYREVTISLDYYGDSVANSLFDIVACALGFVLARSVTAWKSMLFFVATELLLVFTIRDCLTLNVLMLVWPVDFVKQWQMAV